MMKIYQVILYSFLAVTSCCYASVVHVTVWVHGTHPLKALICSKYSPLRARMYTENGLSLAKDLPRYYHFACIARECCVRNPEDFEFDHFYTYGWSSGDVRPINRKKTGRQLYNDLNNLIKEYRKKYDVIKLRLVGFSHGGNVLLNCVSCLPFIESGVDTEVILIATPIQEETRSYVNNPWVSQVYSLYSDSDWIQVMDMQKFHSQAPKRVSWFSCRQFHTTDNVIQVCLKVNDKYIGHLNFKPVLLHFSEIMHDIKSIVKQNKDLRHIHYNLKVT